MHLTMKRELREDRAAINEWPVTGKFRPWTASYLFQLQDRPLRDNLLFNELDKLSTGEEKKTMKTEKKL